MRMDKEIGLRPLDLEAQVVTTTQREGQEWRWVEVVYSILCRPGRWHLGQQLPPLLCSFQEVPVFGEDALHSSMVVLILMSGSRISASDLSLPELLQASSSDLRSSSVLSLASM